MVKKTAPPPASPVESDPDRPIPGTVENFTAPPEPFAHVADTHWGKGGRYVVGADGKRTPAPTILIITEEEPR